MKRPNDIHTTAIAKSSVKDLIESRLDERERLLMEEATSEFDSRWERAQKTLKEREHIILGDLSENDRRFVQESCSISQIVSSLAVSISGGKQEILELMVRKTKLDSDNELPGNLRPTSLDLISEDLLIFDRAARFEAGLGPVSEEDHDGGGSAHFRELSEWLKDDLSGCVRRVASIPERIKSSSSPFEGLSDPSGIRVRLNPIFRTGDTAPYPEVFSDQIHQFQRALSSLAHLDFRRSLEDHKEQIDSKYLRLIAEFSSIIYEAAISTAPCSVDPLVVRKILPALLPQNDSLVRTLIEGIDLFFKRNFNHEKRIQRLVEFESTRRSRLGLG